MSIRELEKRLANEPDNLGLRVTLAGALFDNGRRSDAVELYRSVAIAYRDQGRVQQAMAVCRSILEIAPDDEISRALLSSMGPQSPRPPTLPSLPAVAPRRPSTAPATDETPLPKALPHHVADPTTGTIKKLSELDIPTSERRALRPGSDDSTLPELVGSGPDSTHPTAKRATIPDASSTERIERAYPVETDTEEETSPHGVEALPAPPIPAAATPARTPTQAALTGAFFSAIPQDRRAAILSKLIRRTFEAGATIIPYGESTHPLVLVLSGSLEVRAQRIAPRASGEGVDKVSVVVDTLSSGDYIGERSLLGRVPSVLDITAATESDVLLLLPRDFYEVASSFPALWTKLKELSAKRTREYDAKLSAS